VLVIDDNRDAGGQIWRGERRSKSSTEAGIWFERISRAQIDVIHGARIFDVKGQTALAESGTNLIEIAYRALVLATGARERFLPFPGWTLPNVVGAGGLQALVKSGMPIKGKRVVIAGSGPLLLAVAHYLRDHGADVRLIVEQTPRIKLARFALGLIASPNKGLQALALSRGLSGIPFRYGSWVTRADGNEKVERVLIRTGSKIQTIECDYLAVGFHLVPNLELAALLGCELSHEGVAVDLSQRTSLVDVFCAGETSGIGGLDLSLVEGQIAGYTATGDSESAHRLFGERSRARKFAARLNSTFALRDELKRLPTPETIICRCEDVSWKELQEHGSWRAAKLHTRCGMGPARDVFAAPRSISSWIGRLSLCDHRSSR
jgi:NADPH-dependent 2,4-dienoyl-CoA reductase/sulfur reductase-like enzyme